MSNITVTKSKTNRFTTTAVNSQAKKEMFIFNKLNFLFCKLHGKNDMLQTLALLKAKAAFNMRKHKVRICYSQMKKKRKNEIDIVMSTKNMRGKIFL